MAQMSFLPLDSIVSAQLDDAVACFERRQMAEQHASRLRHRLQWVHTPTQTRLQRVDAESGVCIADLGLQCPELIRLHDDHAQQRIQAFAESAACDAELAQVEQDNAKTSFARVPDVVIRILDALRRHDLLDHYRVVGTYCLFAYEAAAKVSFEPAALATNDVDLLWDVQSRIRFVQRMSKPPRLMLDVLRTADPTFKRDESQKESAINVDGFSVDFLRRQEPCHTDAFPISGHDGDVYPVQAGSAQLLLSSPRFDQVVVGADGRMALMRTVDPLTFVRVKRRLSESDSREFIKRERDRRQAEAVQALMDAGRLRSRLSARLA